MSNTLSVKEVIEILVDKTEYGVDEIKSMIQDTVDSMDNMVTEEGAAYVVADNLGISLEIDQTTHYFTIDQLMPGQSNISMIGRVNRITATRSFVRKDGNPGRVRNIELMDQHGKVRMALWDTKSTIIEDKNIVIGDIIRISGLNSKTGRDGNIELSLSLHGSIEKEQSNEYQASIPAVQHAPVVKVSEINANDSEVSVIVKIVDKRDVYSFEKEGRTSKVVNITIADSTGKITLTAWQQAVDIIIAYNIGDQVKINDLRVGTNKFNDLQLTFSDSSSIAPYDEADLSEVKMSLVETAKSISEIKPGSIVNIIGKVIEIADLRTFERDGETKKVRNISIMDSTAVLKVTFWGNDVDKIDTLRVDQIIRLDGCRAKLSSFSNEVELNFGRTSKLSTEIEVDPLDFEFSDNSISISSITEVIRGVTVKGKVAQIYEKRDVTLSDGRSASVLNLRIQDTEGSFAKVAAWDDVIEKLDGIEEEDGILLKNVKVKPSDEYDPEISISQSSIVTKLTLSEVGPIIQTADKMLGKNYEQTAINYLNKDTKVRIKGTIVRIFKPNFYDACSECNRKVVVEAGELSGECKVHGEVKIIPRLIISLVLDDTTGTVITKFFNDAAEKLIGKSSVEAKEMIERLSDTRAVTQELEMKDIWVKGVVKYDQQRDEQSVNVSSFGYVDLSKENDELLGKYDNLS